MLTVGGGGSIGVGQVLEGKYRVLEVLGSGSMGLVYGAMHETLHRKLAVKTLRAEIARDTDVIQRFQQEARAAGALGHSNIVQIFDAGCTPQGDHYIVMEHLEGQSLEDELGTSGPLAIERAVLILLQVLSALNAAHKRGIVHRDLKPANIFIARNDDVEIVKLLDFGISKILESADPLLSNSDGGSTATRAGSILGTPLYMSPEQARGARVDHRTDIWSAGAVLYEMLCGVPPFDYDHPVRVLNAILDGRFNPPAAIRRDLPGSINAVVVNAMKHQAVERYPSAKIMATALKAAMLEVTPALGPDVHGTGQTLLPNTGTTQPGLAPVPTNPVAAAPTLAPGPGSIPAYASPPTPTRKAPSSAAATSSLDIAGHATAEQAAADEQLLAALDRITVPTEAQAPQTAPMDAAPIPLAQPAASPTPAPRAPKPAAKTVAPDNAFAPPPEDEATAANLQPSIDPRATRGGHMQLDRGPKAGAGSFSRDNPGSLSAQLREQRISASIAALERKRARNFGRLVKIITVLLFLAAIGFYCWRGVRLGYWGLEPPAKERVLLHFRTQPVDAEILRDGIPITERPLAVRPGDSTELVFRAPGRLSIVRQVEPLATGSTHVTVRLPFAIPKLSPDVVYARNSADLPKHEFSNVEELEEARNKLALYEDCITSMFRPLADSRDVFLRSSTKTLRKDKMPAVLPLPTGALGRCRSNIAMAEEYKSDMSALSKAMSGYYKSLKALTPATEDLKRFIDSRAYLKDMATAERIHKIVKREFERSWTGQQTVVRNLQAERLSLQRIELDAIESFSGKNLHWHLRNVVIASQELSVALSVPNAKKLHEERRKDLREKLNEARDFALVHEADLRATKGADPFLKSIPAVLTAEPGKGVVWHNTSVDLFNGLVLY